MLAAKAVGEVEWLNRIDEHAGGKFALIAWNSGEIKGKRLLELLRRPK
jgi:arsenite-transporting ATPase